MHIYFRMKYSLKPRNMHTFALWSFSPYIDLAFVNTMSQNHTTSNGILGRNQINHTALNTVCQIHGNAPWHVIFRVHTLLSLFKPVYALWHTIFIIALALTGIPFSITSALLCRYIRFTSLTNRTSQFPSRITSSSRLPSKTTLCIILPTSFHWEASEEGPWALLGIWHHWHEND